MSTTTYNVDGMTCGHCVSAVTSEVKQIAGVSNVEIDLESGAVTIISEGDLDAEQVRAAVEEAGFELRT